ncbi:MAG: hypothetical protein AAFS12_02835 [Cyanobacteria bacterium J06632_19]
MKRTLAYKIVNFKASQAQYNKKEGTAAQQLKKIVNSKVINV